MSRSIPASTDVEHCNPELAHHCAWLRLAAPGAGWWRERAAAQRHRWPQRLGDLQLLVGPVGREGSQQAVAVAVDPEHGGA
jgi:hypothetical protein